MKIISKITLTNSVWDLRASQMEGGHRDTWEVLRLGLKFEILVPDNPFINWFFLLREVFWKWQMRKVFETAKQFGQWLHSGEYWRDTQTAFCRVSHIFRFSATSHIPRGPALTHTIHIFRYLHASSFCISSLVLSNVPSLKTNSVQRDFDKVFDLHCVKCFWYAAKFLKHKAHLGGWPGGETDRQLFAMSAQFFNLVVFLQNLPLYCTVQNHR